VFVTVRAGMGAPSLASASIINTFVSGELASGTPLERSNFLRTSWRLCWGRRSITPRSTPRLGPRDGLDHGVDDCRKLVELEFLPREEMVAGARPRGDHTLGPNPGFFESAFCR
jgi:hypothetical protein